MAPLLNNLILDAFNGDIKNGKEEQKTRELGFVAVGKC